MESLSMILSSCPPPPLHIHTKTQKSTSHRLNNLLPNSFSFSICTPQITIHHQHSHFPSPKLSSSPFTHSQNHSQNPLQILRKYSILENLTKPILSFVLFNLSTSLHCLASETVVPSAEPGKISLETILVSIDEFFNKNPFFVAGCTFVWLVAVPLVKDYLSKCKFVSAIDAFRKLRDDPNAQLLDIRDDKTLSSLGSPNLAYLKKESVQVQFTDENEDEFVKKVTQKFPNPANTVLCLLDNFDGNSLKVAELLYKNGFKEAYAIRGGVRGKKGWLAIQDTLLPPPIHIKSKKKKKKVKVSQQSEVNGAVSRVEDNKVVDHELTDDTVPQAIVRSRPSSPYPNYPDLKPPSSPTPSKPRD